MPYTHEMRFRPLRLEHAHKCLAGCAAGLAKLDLEGDLQAAFKALGVGKGETTTMHLTHKCRYASLLLMQGRSAWLDHFLHALACGSPLVFVTDRSRPAIDAYSSPRPAYAYYSHLLRPGTHFVHIDRSSPPTYSATARHDLKHLRAQRDAPSLCAQLHEAWRDLANDRARAACIGARGQALARFLTMDAVYTYMADVLRRLAALQAAPRWQRRSVPGRHVDFNALSRDPTFVRLDNLAECLARPAGATREEPVTCGSRLIAAALRSQGKPVL